MAILFDLDGTLLDTSHDLILAANQLLIEEHRSPIDYQQLRPLISFGGKKILAKAFNLNPSENPQDQEYLQFLFVRFIELYRQTNFTNTKPFPGIAQLLSNLEQMNLRWGIVTNKIQSLTEPLLKATGYLENSACVVSGDTTKNPKPHPEPLYYACNILNIAPQACLYIGDSASDIQAGKAAGMHTMAVGFGYVPPGISIATWQPDYIANTVPEILPWIQEWSKKQA